MSDRIKRRHFIAQAGGIGIGLLAAPSVSAQSMSRVLGANDRIRLGIVGAGGRGRSLMGSFKKFPQAEFVAVCDVYEPYQGLALKLSAAGAKATYDYRELLNDKNIDAIVNATPDHWHSQILIDAVQAGKDVYTEKPFSLTIEQGEKMVKAVRATKQIVQVGMQRRSSEAVRSAKKLVDDGVLGEVVMARAQWFWNRKPMPRTATLQGNLDWDRFQGPVKQRRALDAVRFMNWRNFWDYSGGHMTDQGTHLMDVIQWFCNDGNPPQAALSHGEIYVHIGAEVPDTFSAIFEYPRFLATWTLCYGNSYEDSWKIFLQGKQATMVIDDDGYRVFPEPWKRPDIPPKAMHEYKGGIPTEPHVLNFLECIRSRQEPNAPVEVGHKAVSAPHLANLAFHQKRRVALGTDGALTKA
ncbi:MAG: Gfo/Idh/MocA family oxidoreductase [Pyrinomonadaceae bacterium]|nr:Gfo/Idh/MocA family oxidoreductase [Pyrinomonadaceae bacterium]